MVRVCINGGGVAGLATALLLAADGHDVTVVERDPAPPARDPHASWEGWDHRAIRQLRQTHAFLPRFRNVLVDELPHVWARLLEAGVVEHDLATNPPASVPDEDPRDDDDRFHLLLGRRTTVDTVLHNAADDDPRIELLPGVTAQGLDVSSNGRADPRVTALLTDAGVVEADVVVDCGGARSAMPDWVAQAGGVRPEETSEEYRISYWTQWFRPRAGHAAPPLRGMPVVDAGPFSVLRCGADNGWWSTTLIAPADDRRFRALSDRRTLLRALAALPPTTDWVDAGRCVPVGEIVPMFVPVDGRRRYVVDGRPTVAGLVGVGDAVGVTNPTLGRGTTFALMHATALRDVLRAGGDGAAITSAHHERLEADFQPWWEQTVASDHETLTRMRALAAGEPAPPPGPGTVFRHVSQHDPVLWRCLLEVAGVLTPVHEVLARPGIADRIQQTLDRVGPPTTLEVDVDALLGAPRQVSAV